MKKNYDMRIQMATSLLNSQYVKIDKIVLDGKLDVVKGALRIMMTQLGVTVDDINEPHAKFMAGWAIVE